MRMRCAYRPGLRRRSARRTCTASSRRCSRTPTCSTRRWRTTSASAGIPGYVDAYLYAEQATLRKEAVKTEEVAEVAAFLLSPRSSGINAQRLIVDAGMEVNYFDRQLIEKFNRP